MPDELPERLRRDTGWHLARLLTAPHRLGFFSAALMAAAIALWWALVLSTRHAGIALPWAVPPPVAHGLLMVMGFMPLFIVGFLFTAGPRWLSLPDVPARRLLAPVLALLAGWALAMAGFHTHAALAAAGLALVAAGWTAVVWQFLQLLRTSPALDQRHARVIAAAAALGALALWTAAAALAIGHVTAVRLAAQLALWGCLAPIFATVSHRMIPFFTASALPLLDAWRPRWLLWTMLAVLGFSGVGAVAELLWGPLPPALRWVQVAVEAPAAALLLWLAVRWGLVQSLGIRMLAMLHGGFVWFGLSLALAAWSHALMASGREGLGLAPMHALAMGYLGATLIAMITRVSAGHSGRALAADDRAWALYWTLQAAVLLRVGASLWSVGQTPLLMGAVGAWTLAIGGWAWRYGGWLGRPRTDGRPG